MFKLVLEKAEEPEIKLPTSAGSLKKQEFQRNIYLCFIDYAKAFDCLDHKKLWKILREMGIPDHLTCPLRNLYAGQEATVRMDMEQWTGSKLGEEYIKTAFCHPAYLTYAEYIMWNAGLDEAQARIKIAGRKITSDMQMTPPLWQKEKRN